jgi:erythromycin esterase
MKNFLSTAVSALIAISLFQSCGFAEQAPGDLSAYFSKKAVEFDSIDQLRGMLDAAGDRRLVLMGEASHGTHEYYRWRFKMSRYLIKEKDFNFIAVEGDWASIYRLNKYVRNLEGAASSARDVLRDFKRWPQWMWSNTDILEMAEWLREYNDRLPAEEKIGIYGMDVYGLLESMDDLLHYVRSELPHKVERIEDKRNCITRYGDGEHDYARALAGGQDPCHERIQKLYEIVKGHADKVSGENKQVHFKAIQDAFVVRNAEEYYRLAVINNQASWNSRVIHFWETVQKLLDHYGTEARGIVWAHNTHVGDARATPMARNNQLNIGNLSRSGIGEENVYIIGFGTRKGTVNAGTQWGAPMDIMTVPEAVDGSLDYYLGKVGHEQFFLEFNDEDRLNPLLRKPLGHRAVGVTYDPSREQGNYVLTLPAYRYDSLLFFQETTALTPVY